MQIKDFDNLLEIVETPRGGKKSSLADDLGPSFFYNEVDE